MRSRRVESDTVSSASAQERARVTVLKVLSRGGFRFCPISSGVLAVALACGAVDGDADPKKPDASLGGTSGSSGGSAGLGAFAGSVTGGAGGGLVDAAADHSDSAAPKEIVRTCQGKIFQCGDTLDNDGDGLVDAADPDCVSPCGWSEKTLRPGANPGTLVTRTVSTTQTPVPATISATRPCNAIPTWWLRSLILAPTRRIAATTRPQKYLARAPPAPSSKRNSLLTAQAIAAP